MTRVEPTLIVHGHFYQPPRENPWTETVPVEPSAAPHHDWNERITAECYRPNGWARIVDEGGQVLAIVDNYERLSFNAGPTLMSWLERHAPDVVERLVEADQVGGGAIAQAYNHMILPLANERDVRTQIRWGLADFRHRFGREAEGMWLPETAVNDAVLTVLAEEGIRFTILAPGQAARVRPVAGQQLDIGGDAAWTDVSGGAIDTTRAYRWFHPGRQGVGVDIVFYDGGLSHEVAFGVGDLGAQGIVDRAAATAGLVCIATDGETFGHHHRYAERALAYALPVEAPRRGITVTNVGEHLRHHAPTWQVQVVESAWSCAHGVGRWYRDCGCSTGGPPGAQQDWRGPLRAALDLVRDAGLEVFGRRGAKVLDDPWVARDAYGDVVVGARTIDDFAREHITGDRVEALTLLEQQRHALLMYTSCAWFFWDLAGLETVQCLRYAARALDLLAELGETPPEEAFLDVLAGARSNQPGEGDGRSVWRRHVDPARVDADRAVAHLALADLLERHPFGGPVGAFDVIDADAGAGAESIHVHEERGSLGLCCGVVMLRHRRTMRTSRHAYAALHLGGLEVLGAVRAADDGRDEDAVGSLRAAFTAGERVTSLLRRLADGFGDAEFGLESALPGAAEEIVAGAADTLAERFGAEFERLVSDNRRLLSSLARAGLDLPPTLGVAAQLAFARHFAQEVRAQEGSWDPAAYQGAAAVARQAAELGVTFDHHEAAAVLEVTVAAAVDAAVAGDDQAAEAALALLDLAAELQTGLDVEGAQEAVYRALMAGDRRPWLERLGPALGLAVGRLGIPRL